MGRLAVYKFAYFLSILFTIFILGLSIFAYFSGKINPVENMFAAYVALSKPILVVVNTILFIYWLIRLRYWLWIPLTGILLVAACFFLLSFHLGILGKRLCHARKGVIGYVVLQSMRYGVIVLLAQRYIPQ